MAKTTDETEHHQIRYEFTEDEIRHFSTELAESCNKKRHTENEKKEAMSSFKNRLDSQESHISLLSTRISQGYEFQTHPCIVKKDFKKGTKQYLFDGKVVDTVKLTPEDNQLRLEADTADDEDLKFLGK